LQNLEKKRKEVNQVMLTLVVRFVLLMSWVTVRFIPKQSIRKYIPVTILASLITVTVSFIGVHYEFWEVKGGAKKRLWNILTIVIGIFPLGCLWIFHLTFGKFWLYVLANFLNNIIYAYPIVSVLEKIKFIKYKKFNRMSHILVTMTYSLLLYKYQMFLTPITKNQEK